MARRKKKQAKPEGLFSRLKGRLANRSPILLFCLGLALIMAVYFWFYHQDFFNTYIYLPVVHFYADWGSRLLALLGQGATNTGPLISNSEFSINIGKGCDALTPTVLFLAAVLIFPIGFRAKWPALLLAPLGIALLNFLRIISLFLIGIYAPSFFELAHIEIWQAVFIAACFLAWVYWLSRATKKTTAQYGS
ncbi:MAG: archaeosortase/exosortase family protein [Phaeodactylibacter sp.]|nr:archaeosortase/exosortase family protein [Phaeodactylibacter sp.]